jgi:hypothetical protein
MYPAFKQSVLGESILTVQGITNPYGVECVTLIWDYAAKLFPSASIKDTITLGNANTLFTNSNPAYFTKTVNNHNDVNQVPNQGDIMVFGGTPSPGFTNQFPNPYGHSGICDSASRSGYSLLQQNSPTTGAPVNVTSYPWLYRPCIGWLTPINANASAPAPQPVTSVGQTIHLPQTTGPWHLYNDNGPYNPNNPADVKGLIVPANYSGGLTYPIVGDKGGGIYIINSEDYGQGALWTSGSDVQIS